MWQTSYFGLSLAWISPILLGVIVAFVLSRSSGNESGSSPSGKERNDAGSDRLHPA